jgi:hypothetical protein
MRDSIISAAEAAGFDLLLTTDKNMRYQQNLKSQEIAFVVIGNQQWPVLRRYVKEWWLRLTQRCRAAIPRWKFRSGNHWLSLYGSIVPVASEDCKPK